MGTSIERRSANVSSRDADAYHLITDTVIGPNVRWKDNLYQGIAIAVFIAIGAVWGALAFPEGRGFAACAGGTAGAVVGLILSGAFIMVYRAVYHLRRRR